MSSRVRQVELRYNPAQIDRKWQERWERDGLYRVSDEGPRPKWYELTMYPYPSGDLHIGHWYSLAPSDCHARFRRMQGYNVLHPMGFDAFGLPAENAAIKRGIHPYRWTMDNIDNMRRQLRTIGAIYDWSREIVCCLPEYYKWNQWLFLQLYKAGLAYRTRFPAVWCPSCQTVLANEQVINGRCERCDTPITRRELDQWFLRITRYAEELLDFSGLMDWPQRIITMQRNWIGRSEGVEVGFDISHYGLDEREIRVFTTRIDTIFGVTFMVLAPEHPLVARLTAPERRQEVEAYVEATRRESEIERLSTDKEKRGVNIGAYCVNRLSGEKVPIFIADYVLLWYGSGAVMGVPAHDQRDFEFARRYGIPIRVVISPPDWNGEELKEACVEEGLMVNSGPFNGLPSERGKDTVADHVEEHGWGRRAVTYHLRDWLISRQRYWGTPIPIIFCDRCGPIPVPEEQLPVLLPEDTEFKPTGESPLARHPVFPHTICPQCGGQARRETDTMDTFFDSSWYFLRYTSPSHSEGPWDPTVAGKWCPVDQYTGGAEHAVMHLLYARFFTKALRDLGLVTFGEPFLRLYNQGTILSGGAKMSKSRGNVATPDDYVRVFGADVVRCYLMFLGPWEQGGEWSDSGINGAARWLNRVWEIYSKPHPELPKRSELDDNYAKTDELLRRELHRKVKQVENDLDKFKFNTAIAALMTYTNALPSALDARAVSKETWDEIVNVFLRLLAPISPHLSEEMWEKNGLPYSVHSQPFPKWDEGLVTAETVTLVVQVDGKVRDRLQVSVGINEQEAKRLALESARVKQHTGERTVVDLIYVPGKLVNVVTKR
ncbi:MAG: leucine--tRNA ligase [Chloroflexi bacterium]|nr:leucine--tRNA ligase [Chloroflexota bacterium]